MAVSAGYIRVSTASQDHAYQRSAIERAALARGERVERWFADVASGGTMDRPQLARLRAELDARRIRRVWVWRLDRLSRSGVRDTFEAVEHIQGCGATLISVADGFALEGPAAELVMAMLAWAARFERDKIRENQAAARQRIEAQGGKWGRPALPAGLEDHAATLAQHLSVPEIARELKISRRSVHRILARRGLTAAAKKGSRDEG